MKHYILIFILWLVALSASANTFSGRVTDENGVAVEFATVSLLNAGDSTFISGTTTDMKGDFALSHPNGHAIVKITYVGYQPLYITSSGSVGTVRLLPENTTLGEVTVTATRPTFKFTGEGIKTDVDGTLLSHAGTAGAVLENLPGVQKKSESYEVFGKGTPIIYVNGRLLRDNSELDQIQSSDIKSVELITNPGAKYKADVESVILIKTKRAQGEGISFNTQASYSHAEQNSVDAGTNWNWRHGGLDVFGSVWYNDNRYVNKEVIQLDVNTEKHWLMDERSSSYTKGRSIYGSVGVNYIFNDSHALGFRYDTKAWFRNRDFGTVTADVSADGEFYDHLDNSISHETKSNMPHTLNAYYNGKVGKTAIDFTTDYIFYKDRQSQLNDEVSQEQESRMVTSRSVVRNRLWASKLVLSWGVWGGTLQVGAEYDNTRRNDDYINPEQVVPTTFTEQRERNYTVFSEYSHPLPFGQLRLGLRNENVTSDYYNQGTKIAEQSKNYHHFFPTAGVTARMGGVQLMASYGMKIQRPYYYMLSSAVTYANRFTWQSGNPLLQPTVLNEASLMAMWKWVNVMIDYKHSRDVIVNVGESVEGSPETTLITRANVDNSDALRVMTTLSPKFGVWQPQLTMGVIRDWIKIPSPVGFLSPEKPIWLVSLNNNLRLTSTLTATVNLQFTSKGDQQNITLNHPGWYAFARVTKTFFNDRLSLEAGVYNIFNAHEDLTLRYGTRTMRHDNVQNQRRVDLTVRYKFNATRSKWRGGSAGESEKNRLGGSE